MIKCFIVISTILICGINGLRLSPCPNVFNYEEDNHNEGRWDGQIHLYTDVELDGINVTVVLDKYATGLGNWFGETITTDNREFTIRRAEYTLLPGVNVTMKFFVRFKSREIPSVSSIRLNGKTICGQPSTESTTLRDIDDIIQEVIGALPSGSSSSTTPTHKPESAADRPTTYVCGRPEINASPLILYGNYTREGEWPWHLAIYKNELGHSKYSCGGSLISNNYIITAAHCVAIPETEQIEYTYKFLIYIGTMNINIFSSGVQVAQISEITIHPKYNHSNFHNDIAILKTTRSIEFTALIKPVCLWSGDDDLSQVVGKLGTVVGWGFNENEKISENLMRTEMPVVDLTTCIFSNRNFFPRFTTPKSFCAGFRNGSSVCNGDSGSGMVFGKTDDDGELSWYLRGLVSVSVPQKGKLICDPYQYIVFTDVAKYNVWIKQVTGG